LLLDVLTPIVKGWPSQWCLVANDLAIQVHGGYGYSREYPVEQFYRDSRRNAIHEGTHGVRALDLLGRKVVMRDGTGLDLLTATIRATIDRAPVGLAAEAQQLAAAVGRLETVTGRLWAAGDPRVALANASLYLEAAGHIVIAWLWLDMATVATDKPGDFYAGKRGDGVVLLFLRASPCGPPARPAPSAGHVTRRNRQRVVVTARRTTEVQGNPEVRRHPALSGDAARMTSTKSRGPVG